MNKKSSTSKKEPLEDFWDLGDDDPDQEESNKVPEEDQVEESSDENPPEEENREDEEPQGKEAGDEKVEQAKEEPEESKPEESEIASLGELENDPVVKNLEEEPPAPAPKPKLARVKESRRGTAPISMLEKISLIAVIICIVGALAWGISFFYRDAPEGDLVEFIEDFPIKGEHVTVETVETWWRKPVRSGDNADIGVVIGANLIPCARIKLSEGSSTTLQVTFRDGEQNLIGDTINLSVANGKFASNGNDEIIVNSTSGFNNPSRLNAYANEDIAPWSVAIVENNSGGSDSEPLVKARLSASSKAN